MRVVKEGRPQKGWAKNYECTGAGNKGGGCGATLLVEQGDLFHTARHCYDGSSDYFTTFECAACGVLTDIPDGEGPGRPTELPHYSKWKEAKNAGQPK